MVFHFRNLFILGIVLFIVILILCWYFIIPHYAKNKIGRCSFTFWGKYNTEKDCNEKIETYNNNFIKYIPPRREQRREPHREPHREQRREQRREPHREQRREQRREPHREQRREPHREPHREQRRELNSKKLQKIFRSNHPNVNYPNHNKDRIFLPHENYNNTFPTSLVGKGIRNTIKGIN